MAGLEELNFGLGRNWNEQTWDFDPMLSAEPRKSSIEARLLLEGKVSSNGNSESEDPVCTPMNGLATCHQGRGQTSSVTILDDRQSAPMEDALTSTFLHARRPEESLVTFPQLPTSVLEMGSASAGVSTYNDTSATGHVRYASSASQVSSVGCSDKSRLRQSSASSDAIAYDGGRHFSCAISSASLFSLADSDEAGLPSDGSQQSMPNAADDVNHRAHPINNTYVFTAVEVDMGITTPTSTSMVSSPYLAVVPSGDKALESFGSDEINEGQPTYHQLMPVAPVVTVEYQREQPSALMLTQASDGSREVQGSSEPGTSARVSDQNAVVASPSGKSFKSSSKEPKHVAAKVMTSSSAGKSAIKPGSSKESKYAAKAEKTSSVTKRTIKSRVKPPPLLFHRKLNYDQVDAYVKAEGISIKKTSTPKNPSIASVVLYYCRHWRLNKCPYQVELRYESDGNSVRTYRRCQHDHQEHHSSFYHKPELKEKVTVGVRHGLTPSRMRTDVLSMEESDSLSDARLQGLAARERKRSKVGNMDVGELRQWCMDNSLPLDPSEAAQFSVHRAFVAEYVVTPEMVYINITSRHLAEVCARADILQTDATHKVNWNGFPIILVGSQDKNRHIHITSLHIAWRTEHTVVYRKVFESVKQTISRLCQVQYEPQYIMADAHGAIDAAAKVVFPNSKRIMCYLHAIDAMKKQILAKIPNPSIEGPRVLAEIQQLQLSPTDVIFNAASAALLEFWRSDQRMLGTFATYFKTYWLNSQRYWYEGAAGFLPSTNNGIESMNAQIKKHWIGRRLEAIGDFLPKVLAVMHRWSMRCTELGFAEVPEVCPSLWKDTHAWIEAGNYAIVELPQGSDPVPRFAVSDRREHVLSGQEYADLFDNPRIASWFDYSQIILRDWHIVSVLPAGWATCTCRPGLKSYRCPHSLAVEVVELGIRSIPDEYKPLIGGVPRGRGRPRNEKGGFGSGPKKEPGNGLLFKQRKGYRAGPSK